MMPVNSARRISESGTASEPINIVGIPGLTFSVSDATVSWTSSGTATFGGDLTLVLPQVSLTGAMQFSYSSGVFTVALGAAATATDGAPVTFNLGTQAANGDYPLTASIQTGSLQVSAAGVVAPRPETRGPSS